MPRFLRALPIVFLLCSSGCSQTSFDAAAEGRELLQRDAEWADAASDGKDVDKIVSYWSDDAVVIEPGQPVYQGKAAIRAYVVASLKTPGFRIHWVSEKPVFSPDGKMAYMSGKDEMTVPGAGGELMTLHMRGVSIWRNEPDGVWRCVLDIANEPPPG
jgi:ketosteroid isomerase-like protein